MSVEDGYKRCPDCAELVRAEARKCRFCGYRFDGEAPGGVQRSSGTPSSIRELLDEWGTQLADGEEIAFFIAAHARTLDPAADREVDGFLLVTDRRLAVYRPLGRGVLSFLRRAPATAEVAFSISLGDVHRLSIERHWRRAVLRIGDELLISGIGARQLEEIGRHLTRGA